MQQKYQQTTIRIHLQQKSYNNTKLTHNVHKRLVYLLVPHPFHLTVHIAHFQYHRWLASDESCRTTRSPIR